MAPVALSAVLTPCRVHASRAGRRVFQALVSQQRAAYWELEVAAALRLGSGIEPTRFVTVRRTQARGEGGRGW